MPMKRNYTHLHGFTLIELAMVLMIVGLLLGGLLVPLSAQMDQRGVSDTQKSLEEIKEALVGYAVINGQLPCPAVPTITAGQTGAGIARITCTTSADSTGVVPWATLGVNETDAWGNRFTYRVSSDFADAISANTLSYDTAWDCVSTHVCTPPNNPQYSSFALCSCGRLKILSTSSGGTNVAANVPAIIISHGKNGTGAYTQQGVQLSVGSNADEQENSDGNADSNYVSHTATPSFDDQVAWISNSILLNRMVTAGKLP